MASLVQSKSGSAISGTTVTVTLNSSTTAGHCLVVCAGDYAGTFPATVTGITLGGSAGNFVLGESKDATSEPDAEIWADPNCAGGQTVVVVTFSGTVTDAAVWVMEWSGLVTSSVFDTAKNGAAAGAATFSSGSSGTLSQASSLVVGCTFAKIGSGSVTITGPSSPWTSLAQVTPATGTGFIASYQVVSATTAQTYSGSFSGSSVYAAVIAVLKLTAGGGGNPSVLLLLGNP